MQVDGERLREDVEANAEFGKIDAPEGRGRTVLTGTEADRRARERLVNEMEAAGLAVRVDPVGNVVGRWEPDSADPDAAAVASGSHLDSVPEGGIFDGPLGVYAALESVRAMQDAGVEPARPVEVVSFTEEEGGRFGIGTLGSSVATGARPTDEALALTDEEGTTLERCLEGIGFRGHDSVDPGAWDAFLELHVEQGTRLEDAGIPVGVVDAITGVTNCAVVVEGEADHAGSTPMDERRDALCAASEFVLDVERAANEVVAEASSTAVGTVGSFDVSPGARNVVPGRVDLQMDVRDVVHDSMDEIVDRARRSLDRIERGRGVSGSLDRYRDRAPSEMSPRCVEAAVEAADARDVEATVLHSAAMHDAANVADVTDTVLLFAPSRDGISHNPREWTDWVDCARATEVLAGTMAALATDP